MTYAQAKLFKFISDFIADSGGVSPSFAEMRDYMGLKSKSGIHVLVAALAGQGKIKHHSGRARTIEIVRGLDGCCPTCGRAT